MFSILWPIQFNTNEQEQNDGDDDVRKEGTSKTRKSKDREIYNQNKKYT